MIDDQSKTITIDDREYEIDSVNLPPIVGQKTGENKTISCVVFM